MLNLTQYIRSPETRVGPQTTMLSLSQKLPWFGKLNAKEKIAAKEADETEYWLMLCEMSKSYPKNDFRSPLDIPLYLSGTFGEPRNTHFHADSHTFSNGIKTFI